MKDTISGAIANFALQYNLSVAGLCTMIMVRENKVTSIDAKKVDDFFDEFSRLMGFFHEKTLFFMKKPNLIGKIEQK